MFRQPITQSAHSQHPGISSLPISVQHHDINKQEGKIDRRYTIFYFRLLSSTLRSDTPVPPTPILFTTAASWSSKLIYSVSYFRRRQWSPTEDFEERSSMVHPGFPRTLSDKLSPFLGSGFQPSVACVFYKGCSPQCINIPSRLFLSSSRS